MGIASQHDDHSDILLFEKKKQMLRKILLILAIKLKLLT